MTPRARNVLIVILISSAIIGLGLAGNKAPSYTIVAPRIDALPQIDGVRDGAWDAAEPMRVPLRGSISRVPYVEISALHDGEEICLLAQWPDATESLDRTPWEFDGASWRKLPAADHYEDKVGFYWSITECARFDAIGCSAVCHSGGGQSGRLHETTGWPGALNVGSHYAPLEGELLDEWHWKASRTNPFGQVDDGNLTAYRPTEEHEKGGRFGDEPKETAGGYKDNVTEDKSRPSRDFADPAKRGTMLQASEAAPIEDYSKYAAGDRVSALLLAPLEGKRADIAGKGRWVDGRWTLEIRRKLNTGDLNDVNFASGLKRYSFGVAIFNAQQFEHSYSVCVQWLELQE